ncbi:MAG: sulfurtransferase TusA family protein [Pseudomonadota bacterium]
MECEDILDARGLLCPLPVLKARKRLNSMSPGMVLKVLADDPAAVVDIPHYCAESGNELVDKSADGDVQVYLIRKTQKAPSQVSPKEA